jgi:hypothetical protein
MPSPCQLLRPPPPAHAPLSPTPGAGDLQAVLALHNSLRAKHGATPLSWSASLAAGSQDWANGCVMQHSNGGHSSGYGENLAMGYPDPTAAVQVGVNPHPSARLPGCVPGEAMHVAVLRACRRAACMSQDLGVGHCSILHACLRAGPHFHTTCVYVCEPVIVPAAHQRCLATSRACPDSH